MRAFLAQVLLALGALLTLVNGAIRLTGGEPMLLSPLYLREKVSALGRLAAHAVGDAWSPCEPQIEALITRSAKRHGVPTDLAIAVAHAESSLHPHRVSSTGAMGLMQLMPGTAHMLGVSDPFDVAESADGGVRYLAQLLRRYEGDRARAVAAYNAGPGAIPRRGALDLPRETRAYVARVDALARGKSPR